MWNNYIHTVWNLNVCWLIFRTNLHYSDPSTSGWSLEVKFLSVITARILELHLWNLLNILSKEDMISMMLNHMARYAAFKNLSHSTPWKNFFMAFSLYFLDIVDSCFNCGADASWCWFYWCHCRGSYWAGLCRSVLLYVLKIN